MKKAFIVFILALFATPLVAQTTQDEIDLLQAYYGVEKKVLTMEVIKIDDAQKRAEFWKLYQEYEVKRKELGNKRVTLVEKYVEKYETLDAETITKLVAESSSIKLANINLIDEYFAKISKVIDAKSAAQFYQLENYLLNILNIQISDQLPFVDGLEEHHDEIEESSK